MKILILILALHTPDALTIKDGKMINSTSQTVVVGSPEEAAMTVWRADHGGKPMNSYYTGKLFQVDLEVNKVEEVKLPEVKIVTTETK